MAMIEETRPFTTPRWVTAGAALLVTAGALGTLVVVQGMGPSTRPEPATLRAETPPPRARAPAATVPEPSPAAVGALPVAPPPVEEVAEVTPPAPTLVRVPDLTRKRLSVARREARELGLQVVARDEGGVRVPAYEAAFYRVSRQTTEAGTELPEGGTVFVRVRLPRSSFGEGY